ncbi:NAD-dependent epimerase/dehydratase family protein [Nocardioides sp. dk4132]|uniref:NAD-dependent epimerase/dehydratase family protein n=1 Tax=unclassified Nocardioides TaxID=2615069 RepID=UPI001295CB3A|nr:MULTISPECIES: NAD-dependent epimerase/dehydratase family protein [unclassified Nocardioides]MQW77426.1 NAD-dependent epimerase/dehydratase family protein [Nocardioides sp. dk4132]QGA09234.1 NAD-dependent epimerase/dehydratase family protein [Nocardioides sp. dk884]
MRVLLTGGTGFVGCHTAAAIAAAGHDLRLLVRRPDQVPVSLGPRGVEVTDVVVGDVLDESVVAEAVAGCEAVVHAAAVYSLDPRRGAEVRRTNLRAAEVVLGRAVASGLDPVVHVSTTVALTRYAGSGPDLPLGDIDLPYAQSKIASELVARRLQEAGAPVVTVYPGAVYGPDDPYRGDQGERLRWILTGRFPFWPQGGLHVTDVRDVAAVTAAVLEPDRGPRRYVVPGHHVDGDELYAAFAQATGRRFPHVLVPGRLIGPQSRLLDAVQRRLPARWHLPGDREGVEIVLRDTRVDDTPARTELGVEPTPLVSTIGDTVDGLVGSGRVPGRYAR